MKGKQRVRFNFKLSGGSLFAPALVLLGVIFILSFVWVPVSSAQDSPPSIWQVNELESDKTGLSNPVGLAFASQANAFHVLEGESSSATSDLVGLSPLADRKSVARLAGTMQNPINMTYDNVVHRLLLVPDDSSQLLEVREGSDGNLAPRTLTRHDISSWGIRKPQGMTVDASGILFILDASGPSIVRVEPGIEGNLDTATVTEYHLDLPSPRGIAVDTMSGHLHIASPTEKKLYEVSEDGELVNVRDLAQFDLKNPQGMVFAPSGDQTDDPAQLSLFVADGAASENPGQIVELSLVPPATLPAGTTLLPASLVRTFETSVWDHPSPDPGGIDYFPASGQFLITDSEVEESVGNRPPAYWHGYNVFLSSLSGSQVGTCTTYTSGAINLTNNNFSKEPTGVAINANNNHIFFTDDGANGRLFELDPGEDEDYCTSDDTVTRRDIAVVYGSSDAEDVAYGNNTAFIADGTSGEVWVIPLGGDGIMSDDDGPVTHWDTAAMGFHDLEGIGYNKDSGTLFIISTRGAENYLGETSLNGSLLRAYNLSFMGTQNNIRSDVTYAPSSQNPSRRSIYIISRGIDNDANRLENDGKVWEINISDPPTPTASATPSPTLSPTSTLSPTPTNTATPNPALLDADTVGVFRPGNGVIFLKNRNTSGFADIAINYGVGGDYPVVGDWDGDGDATIGVYRNGSFLLRNSNTLGVADWVFPFGQVGDQPIAGDWDGDGDDTIGIYRSSTGQFLLRNSNSAGPENSSFYLGNVGDVGIAGDWNGDGMDTTGVFRPGNGVIYLKNTNASGFAEIELHYGNPGDRPVMGDWNNDGIDTIGIYRNGTFYLRNTNTVGIADIVFALGIPGDMPIAGNWDGLP